MTLVLAYHAVVADGDPIPGFFSFRTGEMAQQLDALRTIWADKPRSLPVVADWLELSPPAVLLTFDDGTEGHYRNAAALLEGHSTRGVFYVSTALLDSPGYLTSDQCREMRARGHAIESHGHEHRPFTDMAEDELGAQLKESRRRLEAIGAGDLRSLAVVGGRYNAIVVRAARAAGFQSLRTLDWGYNQNSGAFLWQSFNINRGLSPLAFRMLVSPRMQFAKRAVFRAKEAFKFSMWRSFYHRLQRESHRKSLPVDG